eukprot:10130155-Heterocapsa_arctica.AAC.1
MQKALGVAGHRMIGVEAIRTPKGDASGGVAIVFQDHCHVSAFSPIEQGEKQLAGERWIIGQL